MDVPWLWRDDTPTIVALVNYENPTIVEAVLAMNAVTFDKTLDRATRITTIL